MTWEYSRARKRCASRGKRLPLFVTLFPVRHPEQAITLVTEVTQNTLYYEVAQDLAAGLCRVKVQGADGVGMSAAFEIRGNVKPCNPIPLEKPNGSRFFNELP